MSNQDSVTDEDDDTRRLSQPEPPIIVGIDSDEHGTAVQINGLCEAPPLLMPDEAEALADDLRVAADLARRTSPSKAAGRGHLPVGGGRLSAGRPERRSR